MNKTHYYLNIKLIKKLMEKRGVTVKQLAEEYNLPEKKLTGYLDGRLTKRIPLKIGIILRVKLDIKIEDMLTTEPPEKG